MRHAETAPTAEPFTLPAQRAAGRPFDPPPELGAPRAAGPLTRLALADGHVGWLVTGYAAARVVLGDSRFSNRPELKHTVKPVMRPNGVNQPSAPGFATRPPPTCWL